MATVLGVIGLVPAGTSYAQTATPSAPTTTQPSDTVGDIVVTAERRVVNVQKAGASISVRSGEDMLKEGKFALSAILEDVPGITGGAALAAGGTAGGGTDNPGSGLVIRGIPSNIGAGGSTTSTASAAAIYVDGVYNGVGSSYDLDRVEILRGPQGTLYGRSATAGLVAIHTRDPDLQAFGGTATAELGNYNLQHYVGALNVPVVSDVLSIRAAGNFYRRDGYIDAKGGAIRSIDGRIKILYAPTDGLSVLIGAAFSDNKDHSGGRVINVSPKPNTIGYLDTPDIASVTAKSRQVWAEFKWNVGFGELTYLPAYRSFTNDGTLLVNGVNGILTQPLSTHKDDFVTQELRLASNPDSKLIWQAGLFLYDNILASRSAAIFGPVTFYQDDILRKKTSAYGIFAEATYPLSSTSRVTAGLRYDDTKISVNELYRAGEALGGGSYELAGDAGKRHFTNLTYKLRLEHDLTKANLLYASVSTGFSPGDVTVAQKATPQGTILEPLEITAETLTSFEIGSKNRFLDNRLQVNGAAFYTKYGAYQSAGINTNPNGFPSVFSTLSSPLVSYGVELEVQVKPTVADRVKFNLGWTRARFVDKPADFAFWVANNDVSSSNNPGSQAPIPLLMSLGYDHVFTLPGDATLTFHGDVRYLSGHSGYYSQLDLLAVPDIADNVRVKSAVLSNLNVTWAVTRSISLTAYIRNVTDHRYITKTIYGSGVYQPSINDPRTFGGLLTVNF
ncbi:TonB-dependent receptor [Sphingomonas fuzhouensis]|uniref:TonB-dependent receptor n=1 Tax=Sphingomonas fuzhouensis TaxID=3106033 RepID=UPI002AFF3AE8|nr:TonB-dependent receptor [Sphingomonas sp. SGZ-02]